MKYVRWILITVLMNLLFASIFTLLYAFVIKQTGNLLRDWTSLSITILVSLSELLAAFITSAKIGKKGLLMGLSSAAIMDAVIALTACLILHQPFGLARIWKMAAILLAGAIGGVLGVNRKQKLQF